MAAMEDDDKPPRPARGKGLIALGVLSFVFVVALAALLFRSEPQTIEGTFTLMEPIRGSGRTTCSGTGGYSDIQAGAPVLLKDGAGEVLATSQLGPGQPVTFAEVFADVLTEPENPTDAALEVSYCRFHFELADFRKADFYSVAVGRSQRGELTYSHKEMTDKDWQVEITLGN